MATPAEKVSPASLARPAEPFPWLQTAWFTTLLLVLFAPVLYSMVQEWFVDEEMGHGIFVPVVAGYIAWIRREHLANLRMTPSWWGLPLVVLGFIMELGGTLGAEFFLSRVGFMVALTGVLLMRGGFPLVRALAFPLFLLLFMIRLPAIIYNQITFPLQILASQLAEVSLLAVGIPVLRNGNVLELPSQQLNVVEACSGIRSLLSLCFLSLVYAFFFDERAWMRGVLLVAAVPIAIAANALRITITGIMSEIDKELATGIYHSLEGWVIFVVALVALFVFHQVLTWSYRRFYADRRVPA